MNQLIESLPQSLYSKFKLMFTERDIIFLLLVALVYSSVYYMPTAIGLLIDIGIAIYCYRSKYPLILLFLFVIVNTRMNGMLDINKLPRISLAGNSVSLLDFLTLTMWVKVLEKYSIIFRSAFGKILLMMYFVLFMAVAVNAIIAGIDSKLAVYMVRVYSYYICYFYVLVYVKDLTDFNFFLKVLFFITLLILANQISLVFVDKQLNTLLFGQEAKYQTAGARFINYTGDYQSDKSRGIIFDGTDPLMLLIASLVCLCLSRETKLRNFMVISVVMVVMCALIEATRSYIVFISLPFLAYMRNIKNMFSLSKILILTVILMLVIFIVIGGFGYSYFHDIFLRLSGLFKFLNAQTRGEVETAVGRIESAKAMISVIVKSPIIGHGFSPESRNWDNDLGFLNTMIIMGFVGLLVFVYLVMKFISTCLTVIRHISSRNPFYTAVYILMYAMIGLFIGYATTQDFFSTSSQNIAFVAIFLGFSEIVMKEALSYENHLLHEHR